MMGAVLLSALIMGLMGSTHCVVMCGGVVSLLSGGLVGLGRSAPAARKRTTLLAIAYNLGRILSYAVAGALAGAFGALADRVPAFRGGGIALRLLAGLLMIGLGLYLAGVWQRFANIERVGAPVWRHIEPHARRLLPVRTAPRALALGMLWGWMPCGLVYAALGLALGTGTALAGAATMAAFGSGTLPMLVLMSAIADRVASAARRVWLRRSAGVVIVAFGLFHLAMVGVQVRDFGATAHACCPTRGAER